MKLYHFCSKKHINSILSEGLTKGRIPMMDLTGEPNGKFISPCQWLTRNREFTQSWEEHSSLPYRRNDYRIVVKIPKDHREKLYKWDEICYEHPQLKRSAQTLNAYGDPENWYCYMDRVKPNWFRTITPNPERELDEAY